MDYEKIFMQANENMKKVFIDFVWYNELLMADSPANMGYISPKKVRYLSLFLAILNNRNLLTNCPFTDKEIDNIFSYIGYKNVLPINFIDEEFKEYGYYVDTFLEFSSLSNLNGIDINHLLRDLQKQEIVKKFLNLVNSPKEKGKTQNNYEKYITKMNISNISIINKAMCVYQALTKKNTLYNDSYNILNSLFISVVCLNSKNFANIGLNITDGENAKLVLDYFNIDIKDSVTKEYKEQVWPKYEGLIKTLEWQVDLQKLKPIVYFYYIFNTQKYKEILINIYQYVFKDKWHEKYSADQILIDTSYIKFMNALYCKVDYQEEIKKNNFEEQEKLEIRELKPEKIAEEKSKVKASPNANSKKGKTSKLLTYGYYLNEETFSYNPAVGRESELKELEIDLLLPEKSILLIGNAGVGKTSIVKGLAYNIQQGNINEYLKDIKILKVDINNLLAGTRYRGDFEEKVKTLIEELIKNPDTIMYLEEMHTTIGLGTSEGVPLDFANILKSYLSDGKIRIIGDTTIEEYHKYILEDNAFRRRFKSITIKEPDDVSLLKIINSVCDVLEEQYHISFGNTERKQLIFQELINLTRDMIMIKEDGINDTKNNPDLVLDVLKLIFAYAKYYNHEEVEKNDIYEGIMNAEGIYESRKKTIISKLNYLFEAKVVPSKHKLIRIPQGFGTK